MQTRYFRLLIALLVPVLFLNQGCATQSNQAMLKQDRAALGPVKMIRYETPGIMKATGTETGVMALATIAVPGGSALLVVGVAVGKSRGAETQSRIPDFGSLVMDRFAENLTRTAPGWPQLTVVKEPQKEDAERNDKITTIELDVKRLAYGSIDLSRGGIMLERGMEKGMISDGFLAKTVVTMKDPQGEVIWQKSYVYLSEDFDRNMSVEELEADGLSLLKDELTFAAEKTVQDFVNHMNGKTN